MKRRALSVILSAMLICSVSMTGCGEKSSVAENPSEQWSSGVIITDDSQTQMQTETEGTKEATKEEGTKEPEKEAARQDAKEETGQEVKKEIRQEVKKEAGQEEKEETEQGKKEEAKEGVKSTAGSAKQPSPAPVKTNNIVQQEASTNSDVVQAGTSGDITANGSSEAGVTVPDESGDRQDIEQETVECSHSYNGGVVEVNVPQAVKRYMYV